MEVAAVGWGISIAGWIISPYITKLLGKAYDLINPGKSGKDLDNLTIHVIPRLALTLQAAAQSGALKKELEGLVKELKSAFEDTEDILDELQYLDIQSKQRRSNSEELDEAGPSNQGIGADHILGPLRGHLKKNVKAIEKLIDKVRETLKIKNEAQSGSRSAEHGPNATAQNENTSAGLTWSVTGRDEIRKQIIEKLHTEDVNPSTSDGTCLSAIGIWGIPGSGKTTLAQYVVKSVEEEKYFDLVMWIHVSKSFSTDVIFKEMFEQASEGGKKCPNYNSRVVLMRKLKKLLTKKRILLVLDDIWFTENFDKRQKFAEIISLLMVGKRGSKILVTSRHENGVKLLGPDVTIIDNSPIPDLDYEVFLKLFMHHAFGKQRTDVPCRGSLMKIGTKIAQKLKKSPLLAAAVGGTLRNNQNEDYWRSVGDQELLDNPDYMGRLWWCYQHLNEQAKRCFAYCSVFPRRRRLYRDELVNLWVAEGFMNSTDRGWEMETFGQVYFDELLSVGFLKQGGKDWNGKDYFVIHDLLYDIAEMVAGSDCFKIEDGMTKPPSDVRHLSIESCNASMITEDIIKLGNLRTLIIFNGEDDMTEQVFDNVFRKLTKLRVLIYKARIKDGKRTSFSFPESISELRYLRFLCFHMRTVMPKIRLPAVLAKLYLLQVLDLGVNRGGSRKFDFSAVDDMTNLINLRHLMNNGEVDFRNIGRLTSLQMIPPLEVRRGEGYGLDQLGNLNELRGKLEILGLESVKRKKEALAAKLADKERLTKLVLKWDSGRPTDVQADAQADVLEGLCPPEGLRYMRLHMYGGSRYPSWMVGPHKSTMQLQELELHHCYYKLPKTINMEHLESLSFYCLEWDDLPDDISLLTSLETLAIDYCRNICRLPALPTSLEYFKLSSCSEEFTRSCTTEGNHNWEEIKNIPNIHIRAGVFEPDRYVRGEKRGGYRWGYL